jgi:O-acetyl-ADP-ribose deacetylase (regulator of RNase III)
MLNQIEIGRGDISHYMAYNASRCMERELLDRIEVRQGDITQLNVDAIVSAANRLLMGGSGVDGAIHRAAGPELLTECQMFNGCPTGEARITRGYDLLARFVIHTVGPVYTGKSDEKELLASCYRNSLSLAAEYNVTSIAFPAISCGVYGYPVKEACKIAVDTTREFLKDNLSIRNVIFMLFSLDSYKAYMNYLKEIS